ncbi:carbonic anhydrase [Ktedonosporobacter rubrisoli]|uniref:carbonic anhydrase n=1 Tax=Ktedonosporobacter rubrisoli TaxID=2509675 RepID=A0A4P6JVJ7_KTERU|nr:carbonic anhydrase [Ktedonosporobacter rubrisoli]QBD79393.1 carbonic anhydrase [Ktedonosporobacter rubrisoli]
MPDEFLANNERFLQQNTLPLIGHAPRKHTAVVTCMDCRLVRMFEDALGLERGDVLELRTAGATISEPERPAGANDLIRSLAGGVYLLGVRQVLVIGHTQCGLSHIEPATLTASMQALGVDPQKLIEQEKLGDINGLIKWLGGFSDVHINVKEVVEVIRSSPYLPRIPVHGLVIDINTGKLTLVDRDTRGTT